MSSIETLVSNSLENRLLEADAYEAVFDPSIDILDLVHAVYPVRKKFTGKSVQIHILNNVQNGYCPEDCHYCPQGKSSKADIAAYPAKANEEVIAEAKAAYEKGAKRYCMVYSGRGPSMRKVEKISGVVKDIKSEVPIEICLCAGLIDEEQAQVLKEAGVDRLNHNLNTSESNYEKICSTHSYEDRVQTLTAAKKAGLSLCSGFIVGMGESNRDLIDLMIELRELKAASIPVNFLIPISGNALTQASQGKLTPDFCLRVLAMARLVYPDAEIRAAGGREGHLRGMEVFSYYLANSIFLDGYLNSKGSPAQQTLQLIKDAGFDIQSDIELDSLLSNDDSAFRVEGVDQLIKNEAELHPTNL